MSTRRTGRPLRARVLRMLALLLGLASPAASSAETITLRPYHELAAEPRVLALTPGVEGSELAALLDRIATSGADVSVAVSGAGLVLVDRPGLEAILAGEPAVTAIHRGAPAPAMSRAAAELDPTGAGLLRWWNEGFEPPTVETGPGGESGANRPIGRDFCGGGRTLREWSELAGRDLARCDQQWAQSRVHFLGGRTVVNALFPASIGLDQWSAASISAALSESIRALDWWKTQTSAELSFVLVNHGRVEIPLNTGDVRLYDNDLIFDACLDVLGYTASCVWPALDEFNLAQTEAHHADWGFCQFILDQGSWWDNPGVAGIASLGGPHTTLVRGCGSLDERLLDVVLVHEYAHIFQALDEYGNWCPLDVCSSARGGYLWAPNWNCFDCYQYDGPCLMGMHLHWGLAQLLEMERYLETCRFTREMIGLWDENGDGILDVRETEPDTEILTALPDTLDHSRNVSLVGRAWDLPFDGADPARFPEPRTLSEIVGVQVSIDRGPWVEAPALDGGFTDVSEHFDYRLPELGGGWHEITARGRNSVGRVDLTPPSVPFFVYDVKLLEEPEVAPGTDRLAILWKVDGEDFGSTYRLYRRYLDDEETEVLVGEIVSDGSPWQQFRIWDEPAIAGSELLYRLEVDIPGKGLKPLALFRHRMTLLGESPGHFVTIGPNPSAADMYFSVRVPWGPAPNRPDQAGDEGRGPLGPTSAPTSRDGGTGDPGDEAPDREPIWRDVTVTVHDVTGRRVRDLGVHRRREAERFTVRWDGRDDSGRPTAPGVYFLRADLGYERDVRKLVRVR